MANIPLKSIKFPDLADTYTVPSDAGELAYNKSATYPADTVGKALQDKPDADGIYPDMTVGNAEQLVSNVFAEDKAPYQFRTAGGSVDIGKRAYFDAIVGGTVAWNQLGDVLANATRNGLTYSTSNGKISITGTVQDAPAYGQFALLKDIQWLRDGRKYLVTLSQALDVGVSGFNHTTRSAFFYTETASTPWGGYVNLHVEENEAVNISNLSVQIFDLTQMFGSTIADYIYSLETANAGAGVAFFRKYFPNSYYPYNAGELVSVSGLSAHKTNGFNQWDEEWVIGNYDSQGNIGNATNQIRTKNKIRVLPNTVYYCRYYNGGSATMNNICFYDADEKYISGTYKASPGTITTPSRACYMTFNMNVAYGTTYNHDICINLSWDGSRDGEYEEYKEHSYPLDDSLTLRGFPKLVDGKLQFDGDEYEPDGTVKRKRNKFTFSGSTSLSNVSADTNTVRAYTGTLSDVKPNNTTTTNILADISTYEPDYIYANDVEGVSENKNPSGNGFWIRISKSKLSTYDSAGLSAYFTTNPVHVEYEKATQTTEEAEPYNGIQIVDDFGTEEFTTDSVVPVGHVTHYPVNLVAKLEMMPNSPGGNGDYIVQQASGINTYIPLASTDTITNIIARLEALENA